ncbi:hypothetical protein [Pseudobacteroides cellulosolvens]|nr:hypothetical protein [Pseudobacteroides cellulosolvens]
MSYMRDIEARLRNPKPSSIEEEIPFWEFLDIEFDKNKKLFILQLTIHKNQVFLSYLKDLLGRQYSI